MDTYYGNITLRLNNFDAESLEEAHKMVDRYIDLLADAQDDAIKWDCVEWEVI